MEKVENGKDKEKISEFVALCVREFSWMYAYWKIIDESRLAVTTVGGGVVKTIMPILVLVNPAAYFEGLLFYYAISVITKKVLQYLRKDRLQIYKDIWEKVPKTEDEAPPAVPVLEVGDETENVKVVTPNEIKTKKYDIIKKAALVIS